MGLKKWMYVTAQIQGKHSGVSITAAYGMKAELRKCNIILCMWVWQRQECVYLWYPSMCFCTFKRAIMQVSIPVCLSFACKLIKCNTVDFSPHQILLWQLFQFLKEAYTVLMPSGHYTHSGLPTITGVLSVTSKDLLDQTLLQRQHLEWRILIPGRNYVGGGGVAIATTHSPSVCAIWSCLSSSSSRRSSCMETTPDASRPKEQHKIWIEIDHKRNKNVLLKDPWETLAGVLISHSFVKSVWPIPIVGPHRLSCAILHG